MTTKVIYEWAVECRDIHGDIYDIHFAKKVNNFSPADLEGRYDLCLYRNTYEMENYGDGDEWGDLKDREYFYPDNPDDLARMTKKHQNEFKRFMRLF